jgi:hypothetical protein
MQRLFGDRRSAPFPSFRSITGTETSKCDHSHRAGPALSPRNSEVVGIGRCASILRISVRSRSLSSAVAFISEGWLGQCRAFDSYVSTAVTCSGGQLDDGKDNAILGACGRLEHGRIAGEDALDW